MAFDQSTRNRLQKFVNDARNLLTEEFTRQLQATYGLDPKAGAVAAVDSLTHLDNRQRQTANVLRETLAHYLATTHGKGEKDRTKQALSRIVREQAFTVLNRLAALRMAEARGFLLETIAKGYNAKGFQLYKQLAGSSLGETGEAYRNYLYSVFDEFSLDLAVLFDRHSAQGRLFPRESALLELLDLINHHEIEPLWAEDETIGWIYQYFNSQEERKKMRAESQTPRNSRELAVRNQFFTPRYVVEFLTDNTLGRIWYEMTQGKTSLIDSCRYLVRRPTEVFLEPGELAPEQKKAAGEAEALSQEELLKQPVYIPHRTIKDPRCIRMLDPACGSMHFGLYAFDLYERIYEEAWQLEAELGAGAFVREGALKPLHHTYESLEDFKAEIPRLIIEHNIHGVDIDPRAVQIAGLSLWQRAQRAWQQQGIKTQLRPVVRKSNIVCAEPMPGEKALLQEFSTSLNPPVLGQLLEAVFDKMELAGEAGTLLKIEEEIQSSIHEARDQWQARSGSNSVSDMFQAELDQATPQKELGFDLRGVDDESFWDGAEQLILAALSDYADKAESKSDQKRLFAEDAAKGFAFIDLCRRRFDVVLMNPPFGEAGKKVAEYCDQHYKTWNKNILCAFVERTKGLSEFGYSASVIDRSLLNKSTYDSFRMKLLLDSDSIDGVLDLGWGVLDGANVEVSSFCLNTYPESQGSPETVFIDLRALDLEDKALALEQQFSNNAQGLITHKTSSFKSLPNFSLIYDLPERLLSAFESYPCMGETGLTAYTGHQLQSDRHFILHWEVDYDKSLYPRGDYEYLYNGGEYSRFVCSPKEICLFGYFSELKPRDVTNYTFVLRNSDQHKKRGINFGVRGEFLDAHLVGDGRIFTVEGQSIPCNSYGESLFVLGYLNSTLASRLLNTYCGQHKYSGYVNLLPLVLIADSDKQEVTELVERLISKKLEVYSTDETSLLFQAPLWASIGEGADVRSEVEAYIASAQRMIDEIYERIDKIFIESIAKSEQSVLDDLKNYKASFQADKPIIKEIAGSYTLDEYLNFDILQYVLGQLFGRWSIDDGFKSRSVITSKDYFEKGLEQPRIGRNGPGILEFDSLDPIYELVEKNSALLSIFSSLGIEDKFLRDCYTEKCKLFDYHLKKYQVGRRQAPIYWPLQTSSGSYTLWVYYHQLNKQTLYTCVNDFIEPKLRKAESELNTLRNKTTRTRQEEIELSRLSECCLELTKFREDILQIAKYWKPDLNDGVHITAAPLWKLFQHKAWQKKLKETWEKLEKGDYDWTHLACSIWPERVFRKCHQDRSLAIAHDVEATFWHEVEVPVKRGKKTTGETKLEWQPKELTDDELDALIQAKIREKKA